MEDAGNLTVIPLLSNYKYGLVRRRLLQTLTGGVRLQRSSCSAHLFQFLLFFAPVFFAVLFIILDVTLDVWSEYYLSLVYSCTVSLVAFGLRFAETCVRWRKEVRVESAESDNALPSSEHFGDEESTEPGACCSYTTVRYLVHPKNAASLFFHSLLATGLLSFASSLLLLPRVLNKHLPVAAAVVVGCLGWLASCVAHYSLNVSSPPEPATYRPTDQLKLKPLMRPTHIICIAAIFIPVRLAVNGPDLYLQLLYCSLCLLPLGWLCGVLPPLEALLPWAMERILVHGMGGSPMATDLRLLVMFLLSLISVLLVAVVGAHSRLAGLLLAACFGYTLSQDLSHFVRIFWSITCKRPRFKIPTLIWFHNKFATNWKVFVLISVLKGVVLLSLSSLLVYVTFMAKCSARVTASETVGGCVLALSVLLWLSATSQGIYVLGVLRNPLHPWNLKTVKKFKQHKVIPCFYGTPLRIILDYVAPLLMLTYVGLARENDILSGPHFWLGAVGTARTLRKVWQNVWSAQVELSVTVVLMLVLPQDNVWIRLGAGTQALVIGLGLDVCGDVLLKLRLIFTYFITFVAKDRKKTHCWLYSLVIAGSLLLPVILLPMVIFSSIISAPLLPLFTLPVYLLSFPRTQRFWPSLVNYGTSYTKCKDSMYYQQVVPKIVQAIARACATGSIFTQPGDYYLFRYQDRILIALVLEVGHNYFCLNVKGLELQETSCHTTEATEIDNIFAAAYASEAPFCHQFWLNTHLLNVLHPVDSAVVRTYSDARIVLTGIIDQPGALEKFPSNLLKCVVWVLYNYATRTNEDTIKLSEVGTRKKEEGAEIKDEEEKRTEYFFDEGKKRDTNQPVSSHAWTKRRNAPQLSTSHTEHCITAGQKPKPVASSQIGLVTLPPEDLDSLSWSSVQSTNVYDSFGMTNQNGSQYLPAQNIPGLIPTDVPLESSLSESSIPINKCTAGSRLIHRHTAGSTVDQTNISAFPSHWLEFPFTKIELNVLLNRFPVDWLTFLESNNQQALFSPKEELAFKRLCTTCTAIMSPIHYSNSSAASLEVLTHQTKPLHIHNGFYGQFPYSTECDWLLGKRDLFALMLTAYRYAVKLLCDETALGEAEDCTELEEYLHSYASDYFIGSEGDPQWEQAVLAQKPHLFSIGKDSENIQNTYTAHVLTLEDQLVHIGRLNPEAVRSTWADLALELLYFTNDDEERYSIQAQPLLLRNLIIQAADPPWGYAVFSSGITSCRASI